MDRAIYLSMKDGSVRGYRYLRSARQLSLQEQKKLVKRYKIDDQARRLSEAKTFPDVAKCFFQQARVAMLRDGYHTSLCLFLRGNSLITLIDITHPDRASRYVIMRDLAKLSRIAGADGVILISEVWTASQEDIPKSGFAVDAPNRREGLVLDAMNAKGERTSLSAKVERRKFGKKVKSLSETVDEAKDDIPFLLYPFMKEWGCIEQNFIERGLSMMEKMGIEAPAIPAELPPERT